MRTVRRPAAGRARDRATGWPTPSTCPSAHAARRRGDPPRRGLVQGEPLRLRARRCAPPASPPSSSTSAVTATARARSTTARSRTSRRWRRCCRAGPGRAARVEHGRLHRARGGAAAWTRRPWWRSARRPASASLRGLRAGASSSAPTHEGLRGVLARHRRARAAAGARRPPAAPARRGRRAGAGRAARARCTRRAPGSRLVEVPGRPSPLDPARRRDDRGGRALHQTGADAPRSSAAASPRPSGRRPKRAARAKGHEAVEEIAQRRRLDADGPRAARASGRRRSAGASASTGQQTSPLKRRRVVLGARRRTNERR